MYLRLKNRVNYTLKKRNFLSSWYHGFLKVRGLLFGYKNNSGRNHFGRVVVFSKCSRKYKKVHRLLINDLRSFSPLSILVNIQMDPNRTSCVGLFFNSLGCWFYSLFPNDLLLFSYVKFFNKKFSYVESDITKFWPKSFIDTKVYSFVTLININGSGIRFIKSAGSVGLFLFKSFLGNISVVILPSLKVKLLSDLDRSFVGRLYYADKQDFLYTKAGYNINKGRGPTVRGTVKNACDHPNGGRTRSLKLSMTPWGFPAKKSRKPRSKDVYKKKEKRTGEVKNVFVKNKHNIDSRLYIKFLSKLSMKGISD